MGTVSSVHIPRGHVAALQRLATAAATYCTTAGCILRLIALHTDQLIVVALLMLLLVLVLMVLMLMMESMMQMVLLLRMLMLLHRAECGMRLASALGVGGESLDLVLETAAAECRRQSGRKELNRWRIIISTDRSSALDRLRRSQQIRAGRLNIHVLDGLLLRARACVQIAVIMLLLLIVAGHKTGRMACFHLIVLVIGGRCRQHNGRSEAVLTLQSPMRRAQFMVAGTVHRPESTSAAGSAHDARRMMMHGVLELPGTSRAWRQVVHQTRDADQEQKEHKHDVEHE